MCRLLLVVVPFILVGCGQLSQNSVTWPAHVASIEGFDSSTGSKVSSYIETLNQQLGLNALDSNPNGAGAPITIRLVSQLDSNSSSPSASSGLRIAGRATIQDDTCLVEIAEFILEDQPNNLLQPVLWHELGHCAGLGHVPQVQQIMSPTTVSWEKYTQSSVQTFLTSFLQSSGMGSTPGKNP